MKQAALFDTLREQALQLGAYRAEWIDVDQIPLDASFRELCAANSCGVYGKCWMCPPDVGDIHELMAELKTYRHALIYQTVGMLEDSYDFEGMQEAGQQFNRLSVQLRRVFAEAGCTQALHLGAGGCRVCESCSKRQDQPCRHPDLALPPLEAYGVFVSRLAEVAHMRYINGQNTVTYFGAVLLRDET